MTTERLVSLPEASDGNGLPLEEPRGELSMAVRFVSPGPVFVNFLSQKDLPEIRKRGTIRFVAHGAGDLYDPLPGTSAARHRALAEAFADKLGLAVEWVLVESAAQAVPALRDGKADVIAIPLSSSVLEAAVIETQATGSQREVVIGKSTESINTLEGLAGREVGVRPTASGVDALRAVAKKGAKGVRAVSLPEALDDDQLITRVEKGKIPLAVVPEPTFLAREPYLRGVSMLVPLGEARATRWLVRSSNPELKRAIDAFVLESALAKPVEPRFNGDLEGMRARGSIRLLTVNSARTYFIERGERVGLDYAAAKKLADRLGVKLEVVVVPSSTQIFDWLREGRGDLAATGILKPSEKEAAVWHSNGYRRTDLVVVRKLGEDADTADPVPALGLGSLSRGARFEPDALLAEVVAGRIPAALVPEDAVRAELAASQPLEIVDRLRRNADIVFATRSSSKELRSEVERFEKSLDPAEMRALEDRLFAVRVESDVSPESAVKGQLSPFDHLFRKYGLEYGIDWRMSAAQAFAESRFNPSAKSYAGALGLFQLMPRTAASLGVTDPSDPEQGARGGMKYLDQMLRRFDPAIPLDNRIRFALGSYNAGYSHIADARRIAAEDGLDPNVWFGNVEKVLLMLENREFARRAPYGWCRGSETSKYVSKIQATYEKFVALVSL